MATIKVGVKGEIATNLTPETKLVCQNEKYTVEFEFDESWAGSTIKTALFIYNGDLIAIPFDGNVCKIPKLINTQLLHIGVKSSDNDVEGLHTTTPARVNCLLSADDLTSNQIPEPQKDVYDQIIELINKYVEVGAMTREQIIDLIGEETDDLQGKIDDALDTYDKSIVGAINEVLGLSNGNKTNIDDAIATAKQEAINEANEYTDNLESVINTTLEYTLTNANNYTDEKVDETAATINGRIDETELDIIQTNEELTRLQDIVVDAYQIAQGAQKAIVFSSYWEMRKNSDIQSGTSEMFNIGQNIYIKTVGVPDLWVYALNEGGDEPDWTQDTIDTVLVNELKEKGTVQVGRWLLAQLETGKVALGEYASQEYVDKAKEEAISASQVKIVRLI